MKLEWGRKVVCPACAMYFYDLMKSPAECPHCGNKFDALEIRSKKRSEDKDDVISNDFEFEVSVDDVIEDDTDHLGDDLDTDLSVKKRKVTDIE